MTKTVTIDPDPAAAANPAAAPSKPRRPTRKATKRTPPAAKAAPAPEPVAVPTPPPAPRVAPPVAPSAPSAVSVAESSSAAWTEALAAANEVRDALTRLGLADEFPRLRGDVTVYGSAMVSLGRITPRAARTLAAVLQAFAQRPDEIARGTGRHRLSA
jgi:hypothetical protein